LSSRSRSTGSLRDTHFILCPRGIPLNPLLRLSCPGHSSLMAPSTPSCRAQPGCTLLALLALLEVGLVGLVGAVIDSFRAVELIVNSLTPTHPTHPTRAIGAAGVLPIAAN